MLNIIVKFKGGNATAITALQAELDIQGASPTLRATAPNGQQQLSMTLEEAEQVFIDGVMVYNQHVLVKPN